MDWNKYKEGIENYPDSFTEGRRNDDLVNWTLAYIATYDYNCTINAQRPVDDFEQLMLGFRDKQIDDLNHYNWENKIKKVANYYLEEDLETLESLLIDVEYN